MGTIPDSYQSAEWRNTTPVSNNNMIGMGFDMEGGTVFRIALSVESARNLAGTLNDYLAISHSAISSGMPSVDATRKPSSMSEARVAILRAKADIARMDAERATCPVNRERLQALSKLTFLQAEEIEGRQGASRETAPAAS